MARCAAPSDVAVPLRVFHAAEANTEDVLHDVTRPFDPASPPLLRAAVLRRDAGWLLGVAASDLVFDALSVPALLRGLERSDTDGATLTARPWRNGNAPGRQSRRSGGRAAQRATLADRGAADLVGRFR